MEDSALVVFFMDGAILGRGTVGQWEGAVYRLVASIHFQAMGERRGGQKPLPSHKKVTGWGNAAGGVGIRYRCGKYDYYPAGTEGRRVARAIGSRVAGGAADSNGEGGTSISREVEPRTLHNPARTVLRPSASAVNYSAS